jgi:outer membrane protein
LESELRNREENKSSNGNDENALPASRVDLLVRIFHHGAVELALKNYPAIRAAQARRQTAEAGVELARTNYLPRADMLWQQNRATRNNVFGLLLPQSTLPSISGPQLDGTSLSSAWGSAGGLMLSWEPFDFGLRNWRTRSAGRQARAKPSRGSR